MNKSNTKSSVATAGNAGAATHRGQAYPTELSQISASPQPWKVSDEVKGAAIVTEIQDANGTPIGCLYRSVQEVYINGWLLCAAVNNYNAKPQTAGLSPDKKDSNV